MHRLVLLLAAASLSLSACGEEKQQDDGRSTAQYIAAADAICKDVKTRIDALQAPTDAASLAAYAEGVVELSADPLKELTALTPPEAIKADAEAYVASVRKSVDVAKQLTLAARAGDQDRIADLSSKAEEADRAGEAAGAKAGFKSCGKD